MDELAALPDEARKLALDRFRLLQPHLEQGRPLRSVAVEAGIPLRTAQRWVMGVSAVWVGRPGAQEAAIATKVHNETCVV